MVARVLRRGFGLPWQRVLGAGGAIKLANLTKRVGDLLQVTKLLTVFEVYNSEYEALEAFRQAA